MIIELERERERESKSETSGVKLLRLVKLRDKRKAKEKDSKEMGEARWNAFWAILGCIPAAIVCEFLRKEISDHPEWAQWLAKLMKLCYYCVIVFGIIMIFAWIYYIFFGYPKLRDEVEQLKTKEKQLEIEISKG